MAGAEAAIDSSRSPSLLGLPTSRQETISKLGHMVVSFLGNPDGGCGRLACRF
jgi:hypothetical protein